VDVECGLDQDSSQGEDERDAGDLADDLRLHALPSGHPPRQLMMARIAGGAPRMKALGGSPASS
jgi:hypothetical protein